MIYKKFELSLSLNGKNIVHIARNYAGNVVFRADTLDDVKLMIDNSILEQERLENEREELRKKKEELRDKKAKRGLFQAPVEEKSKEIIDSEQESILTPPEPQKRVTRGPDGKFISKSQLQTEEEKKKGFWEKLTS